MSDLIEIFNAEQGIVCCVGAGGKKTTMYQLAKAYSGRVGITATAHIEFFPKSLKATKYIGTEEELLEQIEADHASQVIAFAKPSERYKRRAGVSVESIPIFKQKGKFDLLLVKADGARSRYIKAPAEHEPAIPEQADVVIPIVSASVIGKLLTDKLAHRVDRLSAISDMEENQEILPNHVAQLLSSDQGSLRNIKNKEVIPLINMVDDEERRQLATETAKQALGLTDRFDKIVLASMKETQPIVDVISI